MSIVNDTTPVLQAVSTGVQVRRSRLRFPESAPVEDRDNLVEIVGVYNRSGNHTEVPLVFTEDIATELLFDLAELLGREIYTR